MDICLYISDQHAFEVQGYAGDIVRTPNLDRIASDGATFKNAYTPYPVCVPARMAMLTGLYASTNGAMSNLAALNSNIPTFAHVLNASGYETVLCGRMHFVGPDQRHGFERRIAADITQAFHNRPARIATERGAHNRTPQGGPNSVSLVGGGNSPTLEFSRYVADRALGYLEQDHERPQLLCVGTYAPHHPYVAPPELYRHYISRVDIPECTFGVPDHPALTSIFRDKDPELIRAVRAAYRGAVEFEDQQIGRVYDAFQNYLARTGREGVFIYTSDHGEMEGYRGYFGKDTFYESSVHIPLIIVGPGIQAGAQKEGAVSLLDIAPTIIELAGAMKLPRYDGTSLVNELLSDADDLDRTVFAETGGNAVYGDFTYGRMAKRGKHKYFHYEGYDADDVLYDDASDPLELNNLIKCEAAIAQELRECVTRTLSVPVSELRKRAELEAEWMKVLLKCTFDSEDLWHCPPAARDEPNPCVRGTITVEDWLRGMRNGKELAKQLKD